MGSGPNSGIRSEPAAAPDRTDDPAHAVTGHGAGDRTTAGELLAKPVEREHEGSE